MIFNLVTITTNYFLSLKLVYISCFSCSVLIENFFINTYKKKKKKISLKIKFDKTNKNITFTKKLYINLYFFMNKTIY